MQKQPAAVIFDFDGVVVLSEPVHRQAWVDLAEELSEPLPPGFLDKGIGSHDIGLAEDLFVFWNERYPHREILAGKRRCYQKRLRQEVVLVDGVLTAIETLAQRFPLALATSSCQSDIEPVFERFQLGRFFQQVLTIEDVTYPKPNPEIYLLAAARLNVRSEACWVFEDSIPGITAARTAGMQVAALLTTYPAEVLKPYRFAIPDFTDLPAILQELSRSGGAPASQSTTGGARRS